MTRKRRTQTAAFKKQVAVAAIKEELTQAQITSQYEVAYDASEVMVTAGTRGD